MICSRIRCERNRQRFMINLAIDIGGKLVKLFMWGIFLFLSSCGFSDRPSKSEIANEIDVIEHINKYYIQPVYVSGDTDKLQLGFAPGFNMWTESAGKLTSRSLNWLTDYVEKKEPGSFSSTATFDVLEKDIGKSEAWIKLRVVLDDVPVFVDQLLLIRLESGWKITAKIYQRV